MSARVKYRNRGRVRRAARVLHAYTDPADKRTCVIDLLTDLQHYCRFRGIDFDKALTMARMHFEAEK